MEKKHQIGGASARPTASLGQETEQGEEEREQGQEQQQKKGNDTPGSSEIWENSTVSL